MAATTGPPVCRVTPMSPSIENATGTTPSSASLRMAPSRGWMVLGRIYRERGWGASLDDLGPPPSASVRPASTLQGQGRLLLARESNGRGCYNSLLASSPIDTPQGLGRG